MNRQAPSHRRDSLLPYGRQAIDEEDIAAVVDVLRSDWLTQGPEVARFEEAIARYCGAAHGVAFSSGTAALHAACAAAGVGPGDEVVTTPLTFAASANAVLYCGGRPAFADIRAETLTIDPAAMLERISPRTRVILPVDFGGLPADLDDIGSIARARGLVVIEDAAHALGAEYKGRRVGSWADMTVLSFHPVKHVTTGEGGAVVTDDADLAGRLRTFRHHGIVRDAARLSRDEGPWYYEIHELGHNFRITDFQCALGLSQLTKLDGFLARRREIVAAYTKALSRLEEIELVRAPSDRASAHHLFVIQLRPERLRADRRAIFEALRREGLGVQVHYVPVHYHPLYQRRFGYRRGDYPKTERYYERAITLPLFPAMTDEDVQDVIATVERVIVGARR